MNWSSIKPAYETALNNAGVTGNAKSFILSFFRSINTLKNFEAKSGWDKMMDSEQLFKAEGMARRIKSDFLPEFNMLQKELKLVVTNEWESIEVLEYAFA